MLYLGLILTVVAMAEIEGKQILLDATHTTETYCHLTH
jgi:hypothetical protein